MICQPDRASVLLSADWLGMKAVGSGSDPRPDCSGAQGAAAVNHKLPSWVRMVPACGGQVTLVMF